MGHRNPDRVPIAFRRTRCATVGQMLEQRWEVISRCEACGLVMAVDLALIIRVSGRDVVLWDRKARCRRVGCGGFVAFHAKAPGMSVYEPLTSPPRQ
jgi:hypothetical protein